MLLWRKSWASECRLPGHCGRREAPFLSQEGMSHGPGRSSELRERAALCPGGNQGREGKGRARWPGKSGLLEFPGLSQLML